MTKPKSFRQNTDYAMTQGDDGGSLSYLIPAGTTIPAGATRVFEVSRNIGKRNAEIASQGSSTSNAGKWFLGLTFTTDASLSIAGIGPVPWPLYHTLERVSPTTLHAYCEIFNNSPATMTINTAQTITFEVKTSLTPFPAS